jgi:galactose mutarotase-like enzyme
MWKEAVLGEKKVLTVTSTVGALSEKVYLRPGFHPYFSVSPAFTVKVSEEMYTEKTFPKGTMLAVPFEKGIREPRATLTTDTHIISLACHVLDTRDREEFYFSFALWTDKIEEYICIEPVIGGAHLDTNLPAPFTLPNESQITFFFEITATPR